MLHIFKIKKGIDYMADSKITVEHILEVNKELKTGASLSSLERSKMLGMSRKAYKNNALKLNYKFDADVNEFLFIGDNNLNVTTVTKDNTIINKRVNEEKKITKKEDTKYIELEQRIKALEDLVLHSNTTVNNNFIMDSRVSKDVLTRSIKVDKQIIRDFTNLCETKLAMYSKQDLISQALLEFTDKYK